MEQFEVIFIVVVINKWEFCSSNNNNNNKIRQIESSFENGNLFIIKNSNWNKENNQKASTFLTCIEKKRNFHLLFIYLLISHTEMRYILN